jgi:2-polyprenyl-3-methyl-5-hydroxy-6-metoxy-1,4-benzoquinol methylase
MINSESARAMSNSQPHKTDPFWDKQATKYDRAISKHDAQYHQRLSNLKSLIQPTDHVLDFGCASGEIARDLATTAKTVEGIDLSEKMIELATAKAAQNGLSNVSFLATNVFDPRLEPETYDVILALNVLHLAKDHQELIPRLKQLLKPGGRLMVETPCVDEMPWWQKALLYPAGAVGLVPHIHRYTKDAPKAELEHFGFTILGSTYDPTQDFRCSIAAQKPNMN